MVGGDDRSLQVEMTGDAKMNKFITLKKENPMRFAKLMAILTLILGIGFLGCTKEEKREALKQERIEKNLVPSKAELKGPNFSVELTDLKVAMTVDTASKEITEPTLKGSIKITNRSKDNLDIQAITLQYLDGAGKAVVLTDGEKAGTVQPFWKVIKPDENTQGSLDVAIPKMALKERGLGKIDINLVYVPSPLKHETLTLAGKIE